MKPFILVLLSLIISLPARADTLELVKKFQEDFQPIAISDSNRMLLEDAGGLLAIQDLGSSEKIVLSEKLRGAQLLNDISRSGDFLLSKNSRIYYVNSKGKANKVARLAATYYFEDQAAQVRLYRNKILFSDVKDKKVYLMNRFGKELNSLRYQDIFPEAATCYDGKASKIYFSNVNQHGQVLLSPDYRCADEVNSGALWSTKNNQLSYLKNSRENDLFLSNDAVLRLDSSDISVLSKFDLYSGERRRLNSTDIREFMQLFGSALGFPSGQEIGRGIILTDIDSNCLIRNSTDIDASRDLSVNSHGLALIDSASNNDETAKRETFIFRFTKNYREIKNEFCPNIEVTASDCEYTDNGSPDDYSDDRVYCETDFIAKTPDYQPLHSTGIVYNNLMEGNDTVFQNHSDGSGHIEFQSRYDTDGCGPEVRFPYNHSKYRSMFVDNHDTCGSGA